MMAQYQTSAFRSFGITDSYTWSKRSAWTDRLKERVGPRDAKEPHTMHSA